MNTYGVFDILGPIMIGPSSSHTAGAARLGKVARAICGKPMKKSYFSFYTVLLAKLIKVMVQIKL